MASSIIELYVDVPADRQANIFGQFDEHLKLIERTLNVTMIFRDGSLKILGSQEGATQARAIVEELNTLAGRGNTITQQNVNYALSLAMEKICSVMEEIDKDFICNTIQGRPIKPKTLGQKDYVEQIRKKMIVFGVGPAGTGKTYLAMAMAVTAFRNEEVSRIILTRPARSWDSFLAISRARSIPICVLFMMHCIRSWAQTALPKTWRRGSSRLPLLPI